jgi:hypothetical protein
MTQTQQKGPPQNERARRVCEARTNIDLTDAQIGQNIGVAATSVLNWQVRGSINLDNLKGFAALSGYELYWLAFGEGPKSIAPGILDGLRAAFPDTEWSMEHAEMIRVISMKTASGAFTGQLAGSISVILEGLAGARIIQARTMDDPMIDSAAAAAPYLKRDAVKSILNAALN